MVLENPAWCSRPGASTCFLIFINDLPAQIPPSVSSKLFADDFKSYVKILNDNCTDDFNKLLIAVADWSSKWKLPVSYENSSWLLLSNCMVKEPFSFFIDNVKLSESVEVKDLGVTFDSKLNFNSHICNVVAKAKQRLYLLGKSFTHCDDNALILAFKTYIIPLLEYCSHVWSPYRVAEILKLESVQRSFTLNVKSCQSLTYREKLKMWVTIIRKVKSLCWSSSFFTKFLTIWSYWKQRT